MSTAPYAPPPFPGHHPPPEPGPAAPPPGPAAPPPPSGPGVHPPFPAPPVEGRGRRIGLGLGITGGVLALVCGGGAAAVAGLGVAMDDALNEQVDVVVGRYVDAVRDRDFDRAYQQLCPDAKADESQAEFTARMSRTEKITSFQVGDLNPMTYSSVPVRVTYDDGDVASLEADLAQNTTTGAFEVCGLGE